MSVAVLEAAPTTQPNVFLAEDAPPVDTLFEAVRPRPSPETDTCMERLITPADRTALDPAAIHQSRINQLGSPTTRSAGPVIPGPTVTRPLAHGDAIDDRIARIDTALQQPSHWQRVKETSADLAMTAAVTLTSVGVVMSAVGWWLKIVNAQGGLDNPFN